MFWIPGLSILVFCLIMIPSTILGYKKGWRGALFVSILLLVFTMLWVGLGYLIYSSSLWPAYRDHILKRELKVNSIDLNILQDTFKLRVILLFTGILTPITYLFVFLIWKLSGEKINKYMGPKTKDSKEDYKKDMIYRKSATPSRIGGITIMAGSTLFISSMAASAASTLSVPYKHRSNFTDFNDTLGKLYGLGQIGNPADASIIQDFLRKIDGPMVDGIQELSNFGSGHKGNAEPHNCIPNFTTITNTFKGAVWNTLSTLINKDPHAAGVIFKMILDSNNNLPSIDPLRFAHEINNKNNDSVNNQIGYGSARTLEFDHPGMTGTSVEAEFKNHPLAITLAAEVVQELIDHLNRSFVGYDKLAFAKNLNNANTQLSGWEKSLNNKQNELGSWRNKLSSAHRTLKQKTDRYQVITGNPYTVHSHNASQLIFGVSTSESIEYKEYTIANPQPTETSTSPLALAKVKVQQTTDDYNHYTHGTQSQYPIYTDGTYKDKSDTLSAKQTIYDSVKGIRDNKQGHIDTINRSLRYTRSNLSNARNAKSTEMAEKSRLETDVANLRRLINTDTSSLTGIQKDIDDSQREIDRLTALQSSDRTAESNATTDVANKETALQSAQTAYDQAMADPATTDADKVILGTALNNARDALQLSKNALNVIKTRIAAQDVQLGTQTAKHNDALKRQHDTNARISTNQSQLNYDTQRIADLTSSIANHQKTIESLLIDETTYLGQLSTAQADLNDYNRDHYQPALTARNAAQHEYDVASGIKQTKYNAMTNAEGVVAGYESEIRNILPAVTSQNAVAHDAAHEMAKLLRNDWNITSFTQQSAEPSATPAQAFSIAYVTWRIGYQKDIIKNLQKIYNDNLKIYQTYKTKIINVYSAWLRKEL